MISAMERCGFKPADIEQVMLELHEVFLEDFEFEDYDEDEPETDTGETPEDEETEEETL